MANTTIAVLLRGQVQVVLGNLSNAQKHDCAILVSALEERCAPSNQNDIYRTQLRERRQRAAGSLPEVGQSIRMLTNLAYPTTPGDVRETLAKDAQKDSELRLRVNKQDN